MGIAFILLGLVSAGVVADFVAENDLIGSAGRSFALFGGTFRLSEFQVVVGAAVLGALAILFVFLGIGLVRGGWGRRRAFKHHLADLERENRELRTAREEPSTQSRQLHPESREEVLAEH